MASLGHSGRSSTVLGHTYNTLTLRIADELKRKRSAQHFCSVLRNLTNVCGAAFEAVLGQGCACMFWSLDLSASALTPDTTYHRPLVASGASPSPRTCQTL